MKHLARREKIFGKGRSEKAGRPSARRDDDFACLNRAGRCHYVNVTARGIGPQFHHPFVKTQRCAQFSGELQLLFDARLRANVPSAGFKVCGILVPDAELRIALSDFVTCDDFVRDIETPCGCDCALEKTCASWSLNPIAGIRDEEAAVLDEQRHAGARLDIAPNLMRTKRERHIGFPFANRLARDACFTMRRPELVGWCKLIDADGPRSSPREMI